ncbi:phage tail protein [Aquimarina longa]|uniref:phage tail protein n=1 Tax=Aquimarina longa TaxID=1080221 RepID=UPI00130E6CD4|nr:phage tail protein [Aquimarina longa]
MSTFRFRVDWEGTKIGFQEVSGFSFEHDVISYEHGAMAESVPMKSPGKPKYGEITLKSGMFANDEDSMNWFNAIKTDDEARRNITITMLNAKLEPVIVWEVRKAWVKKLDPASLKAGSSEAAIETMTLCNEGYTQKMV